MHSKILVAAALTAAYLLSSGCAVMRVAREPMRVVEHEPLTEAAGSRVVILLPGFGDRPKHFERNGFVDLIREVDPAAHVIAVDAHFGYYRTRTAIERLYEDVLAPVVRAGASEIWLVGISMGGAGATGLAEAHGEHIDGVILLAPYLGGPGIATEITDAGGLDPWDAHTVAGQGERERFFRDIWAWLDGYTSDAERPRMHLGIGDRDRGIRGAELLGQVLESDGYATLEGGHDWSVWRPLFASFAAEAFADPVAAGGGRGAAAEDPNAPSKD